MKRFLLFWIFVLMVLAVFAQGQGGRNDANGQAQRELNTHVTAAQAMDVGYAFMNTGGGSKRAGAQSGAVRKQSMQLVYTGRITDSLTRATTDCYYVFALQPKGFVIVAADERVNPILGYSYDNDFVVENMPDHVCGWLSSYERQIKTAIDRDMEPVAETATKWSRLKSGQPISNTRNGNSVGPLLSTTWNQGQYYNSLCPTDANGPAGHVYTGCVATALAQIINYHQYPQHGRGTHSYSCNYGTLTVDYNSANYDYSNMPVSLTSGSTSLQVDAVATLMRDCGVAVNMGYAADESGAIDQEARAALINFFRYAPNMSFAEKAYFTNDEWETMLRNDLDAGNPVYYSGQGTGGHAFVCDGYNADGYFSFNFGWGGYCNGWYLTSNVNPGGSTFNDSQSAIFGIAPDSTGNVILGQTQGISTFIVDEPLEFYHLMGHNAYEGGNYSNSCNNTVNFVPANSSNQIVADILEFEDQTLSFSDGDGDPLRNLVGGNDNDYSPVVSSQHALQVAYSGNLYYAGFNLSISQTNPNECRMVSNITSHVDTTTLHLTWTENGNATQWEIEYGVKGFTLGTGTLYTATTNTVTIGNLQPVTEYDFYIRAVCDGTHYGPRGKTTLMVEGPCWQDIVTSQPEGYVYDVATNSVQISTAEQLAWWAKTGNSIDGHLAADIDLSGYKWQPTGLSGRNFNGHGHVITNLFVIQGSGFFSECAGGCTIENVGLTNAYVKNNSEAGGLCGTLRGTMRNCYVTNSLIQVKNDETITHSLAGGLVCMNLGMIINCYINADVESYYQGGLLACYSYGTVRNCYASGTLPRLSWCRYGSIAAVASGEISRCYSNVANIGFISYQVGLLTITDVSFFESSGNGWSLLTPIVFEDVTENDLLSALNRGVEMYNDSVYNTWMADTGNINGGYPVFGSKYDVQCPNVTDVSIRNVNLNNQHAVIIGWSENGDASQWLIRYKNHDLSDMVYSYVMSTSNPDTLYGIQLGYEYDFDVRAICGTDHRSGWCSRTEIIDLPYWTDIVNTKPDGYVEDADGNVEIYSAEGLAWFAAIMNGPYHQQYNAFSGKTVTLRSDIDLSGYRWDRIGHDNDWGQGAFCGTFDGQNHRISNIYMNSETGGLFGGVWNGGAVKNVILEGGSITCGILDDGSFADAGGYGYSGGLIGRAVHSREISNCHVSITVHSRYSVPTGALCGEIQCGNTQGTTVSNCSTSGTVYGGAQCGNLIGQILGYVEIRNCYSMGDVYPASEITGLVSCRGVMIGYFEGGAANNCFSSGMVFNCPTAELNMPDSSCYGKVIGCLGQPIIHYLYGQNMANAGLAEYGLDESTSNSLFNHSGNTNTLLNPVSIEGTNHFDLLDALNAWVVLQNDTSLRTWVLDTLTGYPVFGDYYVPTCYSPTDLIVSQATVVGDSTIKTRLAWTQRGEPDHWEVLYVASGESIESGNIISVNDNPCVIAGIPVGQPLDFYVRAICSDSDTSSWCNPATYIPDKLRWTEVVTSQPEGYLKDSDGNVYISSAEGLSWVASMVNRLNGNGYQWFGDIILTKDIDLSAYRWTAIGDSWEHPCYHSFKGNNHVVSGLYCNESSEYQGLFGVMVNHDIQNLTLTQCDVCGTGETGTIVGHINGSLRNCMVNGSVSGSVGLVGYIYNGTIENSCFISKDNKLVYSDENGFLVPGLGYTGDCEMLNCYVGTPNTSAVSNRYYNRASRNYTNGYYSDFSGSSHTWILNSSLYINGAFHSDLVDALNAWVDENNTNGQYNRWVADTNMVNEGYPVFESVTLPAVSSQDTVVAQGYYSWHGMVFTSDTVVTDTLHTLFGYDSVVTYHIIITPSPITEIIADTCSSYIWNGETYSKTGDYVQTFTSANNTDSVVILRLTINPLTGVDEQIICGNSYTWIDGVTYVTNNNTATYMLQTADDCDSVVTLHLTFNQPSSGDTTAMACESFTWYDITYTQSGDYQLTMTNAVGCDSVVTLHLTILPTVTTAAVSDIATNWATCGGNVIHDGDTAVIARGVCWSTSQNPTIADAHTTDGTGTGSFTSTITGLIPSTIYSARAYATTREGTSYGEEVTFTTAASTHIGTTCGDYLIVGENSYTTHPYGNQCWMTQNLRNTNGSEFFNWFDAIASCPTGWHLPSADEWASLGSFVDNNNSQDSYIPLFFEGIDDKQFWQSDNMPYYYDNNYIVALVSYIYGRHIDAYTGMGYFAHEGVDIGVLVRYIRDGNAAALLPTVITSAASGIAATSAISGGNVTDDGGATVTARGVCWSTSQNPTIANAHTTDGIGTGFFTSNITGLTPNTTYYVRAYATNFEGTSYGQEVSLHTSCDTVIHEFNVTACDGYVWHGTTFIESGDYFHTFTNANGCDSVVTLHLTIDCTTYGDTTVVACESFTWYGTTYSESGDYTPSMAHLFNAAGYDSVVTLHLTINQSTEVVETMTLCANELPLLWNGLSCMESGDYSVTYTNSNGCDSVLTLHLVVSPTPTVQLIPSATAFCESVGVSLFAVIDGSEEDVESYTWYENGLMIYGPNSSYFEMWEFPSETAYSYMVMVTTHEGCTSYGYSPDIMVVSQPSVTISLVDGYDATICDGGSIAIIADVTGGYGETSYQWYKNGEQLLGETDQTLHINNLHYGVADSYSVGVFQTGVGCYSDASVAINTLVTVVPSYSVDISGSDNVCEGGTVMLEAMVNHVIAGDILTYQWYYMDSNGQPTPIEGATGSNYSISNILLDDSNDYFVAVNSNFSNCGAMSEVHEVNVIALPIVSVVSDNTIVCPNEDVALAANVSPMDTYNYSWTINGQMQDAHTATFTTSMPDIGAIYATVEVYATNANIVCPVTAFLGIQVAPVPPVTIQGINSIFYGESVTLTASGASVYEWSTGDNTASITIIPTATTIYTVTGTNLYGCVGTASMTVTVNPIIPTVVTSNVSNVTTSTAFCIGNVTSNGGAEVTERGVCWSISHYPTVSDAHTTDGFGSGSFVSSITGLAPNITYYVRTYATNSVGTAYGEEISFTTLCDTTVYEYSVTACDSYVWNGSQYTESGDCLQTFIKANGCDSTVVLHLTINQPTISDTTAVACESFTWEGNTYAESGDYTSYKTNAAGCDSIVTLHLTIIPYDTITLAVNDTLMGSVALAGVLPEGAADLGGGSYRVPRGTELTVKALFDTADFGFLFWTRGNDTLSVDSVYTFTVMGSDEYTAHFEYLPTPYFYVSKTGWATWINPHSGPGAFTRVDVKAADSDQWETLNYSSSITCVQIPSFMLTDSTLYTVRAVLYNYEPSFESREVTFDWFYVACDHFEGVSNFEGEITDQGVALSWDAGEGPQQYLLYRNYSIIDTLTTTSYIDTSGVYSNKYYVRRMFGGSAVCPYNNDSLSMSCQTEARIYIDLTLTTDPPMFGTAAFVLPDNTGHVAIGGTCTVSATANEGYSFTHWTFNGTKVSVQSTYSFDVEQEGELVAHFEYAPATDLYVSRTGWASWNNSHSQPGDNSCVSAQVTLKSIDGQVLFTQTFSQPSANHCQLPTGNFADSTLYLMSVVLADTAGNSSEATTQWYYVACDHLSGFDTVSGVFGQQGVNLSWDYPSSMTFTTATVDYDLFNGFVTDTAVMSNGGDASWAVEPQSTAGPYCNYASNVWVGDRITLSDTTRISEMEVYAFQNDFSTTSPFTGLYIQIYQGSPADSVLVWGNADSNLMTATAFTGCYRGLESNSMIFNLRRPIMSLTASGLDIELSPGTYYFVWSVSVSNTINPVAIPHCEPVVGNTGDYGMLYTEDHGWHTMHDGGSGEPFGFAFHLTGEQVLSPVVEPEATAIYRNGELIDITSSTTYTDSEGSADHSYEVRVVYGGDRHCVYGNAAMSMSCPQPVTLHCGETFTGDTTAVACESFTWYGTTYTETPTVAPTHTLTNASGCDSVVTLHLTINTSVAESFEAIACDSYTWNGETYTESGDYIQTFTAVNGCDSVVTLHLTVNPSFSIEAYLTISENDLPFTYGDTTFMSGTVQSGDYIFNFTTADGCDSVIILHLTVETGINDYSLNASMKLYPNPTKDLVNVQLTMNNEQLEGVNIQVFDVYGRLLEVVNMADARGASLQTAQIDLSRYANGVYLIKAVAEGNVLAVRKVVKR